jgi:DNA-binding NtrC family response regulator
VLLVGRVPEADVRVDASSISRRHAKFIASNGSVEIVDLGSHNGTRLNGERVQGSRALSPGDVVTMGELTFILQSEPHAPPRRVLDANTLRRRLEEEIDRALDYGRTLSMFVLSIGPRADREALAARVLEELDRSDVVGWISAEQLAIVLSELAETRARAMAGDLLAKIAPIAPEARIGLTLCPSDGCDADSLLAGARAAAGIAAPLRVAAAVDASVSHTIGNRTVILADAAMIRLFDLIGRLAPTDLPVLILGETGAGKENAALALHHWGKRAQKPMVTLNCANIQENLVESELFGYEPGAFSDAKTSKPGLLEKANGGTVFLDEVGELSERVQAKLLRVLESKRTTRLGDLREREVDIRIVAATNRDLEAECKAKRFREDLLFRLGAATVSLPPLRQRPREVPILARRFLAEAAARLGRTPVPLSDVVAQKIVSYRWPGNVRELKNAMEYAAAMASERVELGDLPERIRRAVESEGPIETEPEIPLPAAPPKAPSARPSSIPLSEELRLLEQERIREALEKSGGVQTRAAELLGMPIRTFTHKLRQYDLNPRPARKRP